MPHSKFCFITYQKSYNFAPYLHAKAFLPAPNMRDKARPGFTNMHLSWIPLGAPKLTQQTPTTPAPDNTNASIIIEDYFAPHCDLENTLIELHFLYVT